MRILPKTDLIVQNATVRALCLGFAKMIALRNKSEPGRGSVGSAPIQDRGPYRSTRRYRVPVLTRFQARYLPRSRNGISMRALFQP